MRQKRKYKYRRLRQPKIRGWKKKHRAEIKISDITAEGFKLHTFNKDFYIARDLFAWFLGATHREIQDVTLYPCPCDNPLECTCKCPSDHPGDHFRWESLDLDFCTGDFNKPEQRYIPQSQSANAYRERYYKRAVK